jgi:hypothetical protein
MWFSEHGVDERLYDEAHVSEGIDLGSGSIGHYILALSYESSRPHCRCRCGC